MASSTLFDGFKLIDLAAYTLQAVREHDMRRVRVFPDDLRNSHVLGYHVVMHERMV